MTTTSLASTWTDQPPAATALEAMTRLHWSVFPLDEEKKPPQLGAYHPDGTPKRLAWKPYQSRRATEREVRTWQQQYHPSAYAVITGALSGVVILDFDGQAGKRTLSRLELDPHVQTGSGGFHVYFQHPGWPVQTLNSTSKRELGRRYPGMDIRADGGYGAFCGRNTQGRYIWLRDPIPEPLTLLPDDLRAFLGLLEPPGQAPYAPKPDARARVPHAPGAAALIERALGRIGPSVGRNDAGFWLACQLRDHGFTHAEARVALASYAEQAPKTNRKGDEEPYTEAEAHASVASAYSLPARDGRAPMPLPGSDRGGAGSISTVVGTSTPEEGLPEIILATCSCARSPTRPSKR